MTVIEEPIKWWPGSLNSRRPDELTQDQRWLEVLGDIVGQGKKTGDEQKRMKKLHCRMWRAAWQGLSTKPTIYCIGLTIPSDWCNKTWLQSFWSLSKQCVKNLGAIRIIFTLEIGNDSVGQLNPVSLFLVLLPPSFKSYLAQYIYQWHSRTCCIRLEFWLHCIRYIGKLIKTMTHCTFMKPSKSAMYAMLWCIHTYIRLYLNTFILRYHSDSPY